MWWEKIFPNHATYPSMFLKYAVKQTFYQEFLNNCVMWHLNEICIFILILCLVNMICLVCMYRSNFWGIATLTSGLHHVLNCVTNLSRTEQVDKGWGRQGDRRERERDQTSPLTCGSGIILDPRQWNSKCLVFISDLDLLEDSSSTVNIICEGKFVYLLTLVVGLFYNDIYVFRFLYCVPLTFIMLVYTVH